MILPSQTTAPTPALQACAHARETLGARVFVAMRRRHLRPGTLSSELLGACLPASPYEARSLYRRLTGSSQASACPKPELRQQEAMRQALPESLRWHAPILGAIVLVIDDCIQARTHLHQQLCQARAQLKCTARTKASTSALQAAQTSLQALSADVYSYPFCPASAAVWPSLGADIPTHGAPAPAHAQKAPPPDETAPHRSEGKRGK